VYRQDTYRTYGWDDNRFDGRSYRHSIPRDSHILTRGHGEIAARARGDGVVYLYDANDQRVVWTGHVRDGDQIKIDARKDRAWVNGVTVYNRNLVKDHEHRIYLAHR
jgi:hypothetical protein